MNLGWDKVRLVTQPIKLNSLAFDGEINIELELTLQPSIQAY